MDDNILPKWMLDSLPVWVTNEKKLTHWRLIQQLKLFRLKQKVKKGEYVYRQNFEEYKNNIRLIFEEMTTKQLSDTQIDYLTSLKNPEKIKYYLNQMMKAALWEIAYSKKSYDAINKMIDGNQEISKELFQNMKKALGFEYNFIAAGKRDENIVWYRNEIIKALETSEDRVRYILDEIKKICEYDSVLSVIQNCTHMNTLPKRDRKKIHKEKQKFYKMKEDTIKYMKILKASKEAIEEIEQKEYRNDEKYGWVNYEKTLAHLKKTLYEELTLMCGTGKKRAGAIVKILEFI